MENQKVVELEMVNQRLGELDRELANVERQVDHANLALHMLAELDTAKADQELLVPIGNGIFIEVQAQNIHKVKMAVGANVVVDLATQDAKQEVEKQLTEIKQYHTELLSAFEQTSQKAQQLQTELDKQ